MTTNGSSYVLDIPDQLIAVNYQNLIFRYDSSLCNIHNSITTCDPALIQLHHIPTSCGETIATNNTKYLNFCLSALKLTKPTKQYYIFKNNYKTIRIFTPQQDTLTKICGTDTKYNNTILETGFTDITFRSNCFLQTRELTIMSPIIPEDNTEIQISQTLPDLDKAMQNLENLITIHTSLNLSQLKSDFDRLSSNINIETIDLKSVKDELEKSQAINAVKTFNPIKINIDDFHPLSTTVTLVSWSLILMFLVITIITCRLCFPVTFLKVLTLAGKSLYSLFCCFATILCRLSRFVPQSQQPSHETTIRFTSSQRQHPSDETVRFLDQQLPLNKHIYASVFPPTAPKPPKRLNPPHPTHLSENEIQHYTTSFITNAPSPTQEEMLYAANPDIIPIITSLNSITTDTHWYIWKNQDRLRLVRRSKNLFIIYNSITRQCVDLQGQPLACNKFPSPSDIIQYKNSIRAANPPNTILKDTVHFLVDKPDYYFDDNTKTYRNEKNEILDGYKPLMSC
jgi:hypothetical protein